MDDVRKDASESELRSAVLGLGMLCEGIDNAFRGAIRAGGSEGADAASFLAVYSSAKRLIKLIRMAQGTHQLRGRAAAEVDGDVDNQGCAA
ncbi:hypothetical protein [Couchioplanes azureus]|uniref:hypothetical protein n=1 Tax=Couchioplanes caeruleus TaxID=56438 RepID=UPI001670E0CC|nr:hypothetical protein [Couchioplanes caeruleus]